MENYHLLVGSAGVRANSAAEVLYAAAWICGEFSSHLSNPAETLRSMFRGRVTTLPGHIQAVYIQNGLKLFSNITRDALQGEKEAVDGSERERVTELAKYLEAKMSDLVVSSDLEVQERASSVLEVLRYVIKQLEGASLEGYDASQVCESVHLQKLHFLIVESFLR